MGEALISGAGGGAGAKIYRWKRYNLNTSTTYWWHRYSLVSTTTYNWNKWNTKQQTTNGPTIEYGVSGWDRATTNGSYYSYNQPYVNSSNRWEATKTGNVIRLSYWSSDLVGYWFAARQSAWAFDVMTWGSSSSTYSGDFIYVTQGYQFHGYEDEDNLYGSVKGNYYSVKSSTSTVRGDTLIETVSSTSSSAYPANGISGSYWYVSAGSTTTSSKGSTNYGYVTSSSRYTYPDNGASGSYWYEYDYSPTYSYSQGSYIDDVFGTDPNLHPQNGKDGSYWYVYSGEAN